MIIQEYYSTRNDGVRLIRTYSDLNVYIQGENGINYAEAVDPEEKHRTYTETNIPIEIAPEPDISSEEILEILLGGE